MIRLLARRILLAIPTLIGITLITFLLVHLSPGGDAPLLDADPESGIATRAAPDDAPILVQYAKWLGRLPDLGISRVRGRPCADLIAERLPTTLALTIPSLAIIALVAIPLGVIAARRAGTTVDRAISGTVLALWSVPVVWAATLAVTILGSRAIMGDHALPIRGLHSPESDALPLGPWLLDFARHAFLPILCLVYAGLAVLTRQTRSAVLEALAHPSITAARAKGVPESGIVWRHALSNSLLPIITLLSSAFAGVFAGSVIVESVFSIDGMGRLLLDAISRRDRELILAITTIGALITMVSVLVADLAISAVDPRTIRRGPSL
jgi:peptide/nickel transport system permease protein